MSKPKQWNPSWISQVHSKEAWTRGSAVDIVWSCSDPLVTHVKIELGSRAFEAMTCVVECTPNTGHYLYRKVPWGMPIRKDYFLRFTAYNSDESPIETEDFPIAS